MPDQTDLTLEKLELNKRVSTLETKIEVLTTAVDKDREHLKDTLEVIKKYAVDTNTKVKDQNGRVGKLESWQNKVIGAILIISIFLLPIGIEVIKLSFEKQINKQRIDDFTDNSFRNRANGMSTLSNSRS